MFKGINVVSVCVPDLDEARLFYGTTLGLGRPIYDLPEAGWIEFSTGGAGNISITRAEPGWKPDFATTIVLNVDDCHAAAAELKRRGRPVRGSAGFPRFRHVCQLL